MCLKKVRVLLFMKFFAALFLIFMLTKSLQIVQNLQGEISGETNNEAIKLLYENDLCNRFNLFHIFAFVLGAFWNVKRLLKVGIV